MKNLVRRVRQEKHLSMEKLAVRCDVSQETIKNIETRASKPNVYLALKIASALESRVDELFYL